MSASTAPEIAIDLDQPDEVLVEQIARTVTDLEHTVKSQGEVQLAFRLTKSGAADRAFTYTLTSDAFTAAEQDVVFPRVVSEILRKEFPAKVAQNEQLRRHVIEELKKDPYWSTQVVALIKAMRSRG